MARGSSNNCGCGCLSFILVILIGYGISRCIGSSTSSPTSKDERASSYYDSHSNTMASEDVLSEEDRKYLSNSLTTGATPYRSVYGPNYRCPYSQCSGISVTAPTQSDIVVIIKEGNADGKVVAHGYISAGGTYQFDVPDGTYQTFFYYGEGWNPNKDMGNGVKGGFVKNEIFSKDNPQVIFSAVLSYVLQLQHNGNFSTKSSNRGEVF